MGTFGNGTRILASVPAQGPPNTYTSLSLGVMHACGMASVSVLQSKSALWCWGLNRAGALGYGVDDTVRLSPVLVSSTLVRVAAGAYSTCGLDANDAAFCWGLGAEGQLGTGVVPATTCNDAHWSLVSSQPCALGPQPVAGGHQFRLLTVGGGVTLFLNDLFSTPASGHACALDEAGAAWCWGANDNGQAGPGGSTCAASGQPCLLQPSLIPGPSFVDIGAGASFTCALDAAGDIWCWGANDRGQLGDGTTTSRAMPAKVVTDRPFDRLAVGRAHSCAIARDGSLWCWGDNTYSQTGAPSAPFEATPVRVTDVLF